MYYLDPDTKNVITYDYFGGNIQGIKEKLSYLKDLGISVIYFNPIFKQKKQEIDETLLNDEIEQVEFENFKKSLRTDLFLKIEFGKSDLKMLELSVLKWQKNGDVQE